MSDNTSFYSSSIYDIKVNDTIPYYSQFHNETISLVKSIMKEPNIWLDTGCGTGNLIHKALNEFEYTRFILADPSREMLKIAKEKLDFTNRVKFLNPTSTQQININDKELIDVITAIQSHHYLSKENRIKSIKKCYKLLKNSGIFITFENIKPNSNEGTKVTQNRWFEYQINRGKDYESATNHIQRFNKEYFPITVEEHIKILKEAEFKVVELLWYSYMQAGFYCIK